MSDGFDELERRLARAVRASAGRRRWGERRRNGIALGAVIVLGGGGVALATTTLRHGESADTRGRKIALRAVEATASQSACRRVTHEDRYVAGALPAEIRATLPALARPASAADRAAVKRARPSLRGGDVLEQSLHLVHLGAVTLTVAVAAGDGPFAVRDPAAGRAPAVDAAAHRRLAQLRDTIIGEHLLDVSYAIDSAPDGRPGVGIPVAPGVPLRPGPIASASPLQAGTGTDAHPALRARPGIVVGIAGRDVVAARVHARHHPRGTPRAAVVRSGFYALTLPRGTGPVHLDLLDAAGRGIRTDKLRG